MEKLTTLAHAVMCSLYKLPRNVWVIRTPNCKQSVILLLYNMGLIYTDRLYQGHPLRFKITKEGEEYGREYCRTDQGITT